MKTIVITIAMLIGAQVATADIIKTPIHNAEVIIFDATCTAKSTAEGYLTVSLQMTTNELFIRGEFYSYSAASAAKDPKNGHLISLKDCQNAQSDLRQKAGRHLTFSGQSFVQAYEVLEDIWGTCREHPLAGGGTYDCKKGTRKVTKVDRETELNIEFNAEFNVGSITIFNKNR